VLLEGVEEQVVLRHRALPAVLVVLAVVVLASLEVAPISLLALGGTLAMVLGGCLTSREAYRAIDLRLLVLMAGTIGLGRALESSGGAAFLAEHITRFARPFGDVGLLSAVYLVCNLLTALVSNAAAALITLPIAIAAANQAGLEVKPFLMAVLFAASVDFSTPIGYQTNTLVYGPGGYRFADYLKVGGPLNLLWWLLATALIPVLWPLRA
jgi:di/tricarboxylate transporter